MSSKYYVNGSAARTIAQPATQPGVRPDVEEQRRERERKLRRLKTIRRNRRRALLGNLMRTCAIVACVVMCAIAVASIIRTEASIKNRMRQIANLEGQIEELRVDNDDYYKKIMTSVDMNEIKNIAMDQLGMVYATEGQVVYFSIENNNFMDQYGEIPQQ